MVKTEYFLVLIIGMLLISGCSKNIISDLSKCKNMDDDTSFSPISQKSACYIEIAIKNQDLSACNQIQDKFSRDTCYADVAEIKESISICNQIKNPLFTSACYKKIAEIKKDPIVCDQIKNDKLEEDYKQECMTTVAIAKGDPSICDDIEAEYDKEECYFNVARIKKIF